jgi:NADH:ubiquinone oxidoreductase subunit 4 (subunit M)
MYIVAIGWMFVVVCMAAVEATTSSVAGAIVTLLFYGLLPLALFLWLVGTPQRRRNRGRRAERVAGASFTPRKRDDDG